MLSWKQFENTSTIELIKQIQKRKDPKETSSSESAFYAFVFRFEPELTKKTEVICGNWGFNTDETTEVVQKVFEKFWKYPNFKIEKIKQQNIDKAVLFYLYGIARNELTDYYSIKNGLKISPYDGSEQIIYDLPSIEYQEDYEIEYQSSNVRFRAIKSALETLSEKHKVIYLTYITHERSGKKLPRPLLNKMREELGINQATIRSYKKDVFDKVEEYINIYENIKA